jgi:serine/threonine protein kinase
MQYPSQYGNYTLLESIGEGGMSEIDLAQATVADAQYIRFLVIKRVRGQLLENESHIRMFQDEARICAELQHANIAQVYDFGRVDNEFFIAMEYIPGVDLRELQKALTRRQKGLPIRISLRILYDILSALDYAHHRVDTFGKPMNIVHRDVNPRNVMLSVRGEVKLIDFGVAKSSAKQDQTVGHIIKGKFAYMAPEQIEGGDIDGRADIFAAGLMLHEMVEGSRPFQGLSEIQIMHRIISGAIPKLTGQSDYPNPEIIHQIHQKALQVDQQKRFRTAKDMQESLLNAAELCNGMATPQELAQFLSQNITKQVASISERLHYYRREVTSSLADAPTDIMNAPKKNVTKRKVDVRPKDDTDFPTINQVAPKLPAIEQRDKEKPSHLITIILGFIAILVMGVFVFLLSQKNNSNIQPTQVTTLKPDSPESEKPPKDDSAENIGSRRNNQFLLSKQSQKKMSHPNR